MSVLQITCESEAATARFAETLALALKSGDLVTLDGDLGAGKTFLTRALLRSAAQDLELEVPSPTFTLVQPYSDLPFGTLAHCDLYRIEDPEETAELGLEEALETGVVIMEWPDRGGKFIPQPALKLSLKQGSEDHCREISVDGMDVAMGRVRRSLMVRGFLDANGHTNSRRTHLNGDASSRAYETISPLVRAPILLMNAPVQPDGPPIKDGKPYSQIARLAEDMTSFVAVAKALLEAGFRTPTIYAHDIENGLLLIEDLGTGSILTAERSPIEDRYLASVEALAKLHQTYWPAEHRVSDSVSYVIPTFDREAMLIEVDLLPKWYAPYQIDRELSGAEAEEFEALWNEIITQLNSAETSILLRDYHSPNIIWQEEKSGLNRIGLIDFQDALIGPTAYDVASIAQDARVNISPELEEQMLDHYCISRGDFDEAGFRAAYAMMAAERATKILGIFVRLSKRDNKHDYLAHLPRIEDYLRRSLDHPALTRYKTWVESVLWR